MKVELVLRGDFTVNFEKNQYKTRKFGVKFSKLKIGLRFGQSTLSMGIYCQKLLRSIS